jgi:hypothetical protein
MMTQAAITKPEITAFAARHISTSPCFFFILLEDRDKGRRQRAFAKQPPEQVGNGESILKRVVNPADAHEVVVNHLAHHAEDAAGERGGGHCAGGFQHF